MFKDISECSNVRQNLNSKLIAMSQCILRRSAHSNTCGSTGDDDRSSRECSTLRQPADDLGDREDEIAKRSQ